MNTLGTQTMEEELEVMEAMKIEGDLLEDMRREGEEGRIEGEELKILVLKLGGSQDMKREDLWSMTTLSTGSEDTTPPATRTAR